MDMELYRLCRDVHDRTGWKDTDKVFALTGYLSGPGEWIIRDNSYIDKPTPSLLIHVSLYAIDYLLDRLPKWIEPQKNTPHLLTLQPNPIGRGWQALYRLSVATPTSDRRHADEIHTSDTPLKALLKLTIALHEAGELKAGDA